FTVMAPVLKVSPGDFFTVRTYQNSGGALWSAVHFSVVGLDPGAGSATALKTASLDQSVNVPNGWGGNVSFTSPTFDTANLWSANSPTRLTVASAAYVQVSATIWLDYHCSVCEIYVVRNDTEVVAWSYGATANTGFGGDNFTALAPLVRVNPGDYFTARV